MIYVDLRLIRGAIDVKFENRKTYITAKLREAVELGRIFGRCRDMEVHEYSAATDILFEPRLRRQG